MEGGENPMNFDLSSLGNGAVAERFGIEMQKAIANLMDPNTDPKKARTVTLKLTMKGDENRDIAITQIETKSALAPAKNIETKIVMDYDSQGRPIGAELKSGTKNQTYIDNDGDVADDRGNKITDLQRRREAAK
jgi:hypothetical protein